VDALSSAASAKERVPMRTEPIRKILRYFFITQISCQASPA
jgi:hypothetical protein